METSNWIAVGALAVSAVNTAVFLAAPWWRGRAARFEVSHRIVPTPSRTGERNEDQIVLRNSGAAQATHVQVSLWTQEGEPSDPYFYRPPPPTVQPAQTLHLPLIMMSSSRLVDVVEIRWRDRRRGEHVERHAVVAYFVA